MITEREEEYTGFNAQNDPDFLYAEDDAPISEQTKDIYANLETVSIDPKESQPFFPKQIKMKVTDKKQKFSGIQGGRRTIDVKNPDYSSYQRKRLALERSQEIWKGRLEGYEIAFNSAKEEWKSKHSSDPEVFKTQTEELDLLYKSNVRPIEKTRDSVVKKLQSIDQQFKELGPEPTMFKTIVTDVAVPARELQEWQEAQERKDK